MAATQHARSVVFATFMVLLLGISVGQAKPPPAASDGSTPGTHIGAKAKPQPLDTTPKGPDLDAFAQAYERANQPPILVLVGRDTRIYQTPGQSATGIRSDIVGSVTGGHLNLIDAEGNALKLHGDIEEMLLHIPDVELLNLDALAESDRREVALLQEQDEYRAVDLLATKLNAELVLLVKLIDTHAVHDKGARYRVLVETIDVPRGRKIGGFTFDWMQDTDSITIKRYANEIARKFMEQFVRAKQRGGEAGAARKFTVKFIGLEEANQMRSARDAFKRVDGVSKVLTRGMSKAGGDSVATLEVTYAGDPLDLVFDVQDEMTKTLGMAADASDVQAGTITFKATSILPDINPNYVIRVIGVDQASDAVQIRKQFLAITGVTSVIDQGLPSMRDGKLRGEWRVVYNGQPLDLLEQTTASVRDVTGELVQSELIYETDTKTRERMPVINLLITGPTPRWIILMSEKDPQYETMRAQLLTEYRDEGSPKIGIMVNRALVEVDENTDPSIEQEVIRLLRDDPENEHLKGLIATLSTQGNEHDNTVISGTKPTGTSEAGQEAPGIRQSSQPGKGDGVVVAINLISGDVNNASGTAKPSPTTTGRNTDAKETTNPAGEAETFNVQLNNLQVENAIYKQFIRLGMTMVDPNSVRDRIAAKAEKAKRIYKEDELVWLLGREAGLDIVILGHGKLVSPQKIGNRDEHPSIVYTFRAVRVNDGITLAADTYAADLSGYGGQDEEHVFIDSIARYFTGNLADQLWTQWQPPRMITVTLHNVKTQKDVITVMKSVRDNIAAVQDVTFIKHEAGVEGGFGEFTIRYKDTYEALIENIARQEKDLPFDLDASGTDRDTLTIRLRD